MQRCTGHSLSYYYLALMHHNGLGRPRNCEIAVTVCHLNSFPSASCRILCLFPSPYPPHTHTSPAVFGSCALLVIAVPPHPPSARPIGCPGQCLMTSSPHNHSTSRMCVTGAAPRTTSTKALTPTRTAMWPEPWSTTSTLPSWVWKSPNSTRPTYWTTVCIVARQRDSDVGDIHGCSCKQ